MSKIFRKYIIWGIRVRLDSGKEVIPQDGAWYDGRQYFKKRLGEPGMIIMGYKAFFQHAYLKSSFDPREKGKHACHRYGLKCDLPDDPSIERRKNAKSK